MKNKKVEKLTEELVKYYWDCLYKEFVKKYLPNLKIVVKKEL